jgi:hypothetical protein
MITACHAVPWHPATQGAEDEFDLAWCSRCGKHVRPNAGKLLRGVAADYPAEWVRDPGVAAPDGNPRCTAFAARAQPPGRDDPRQQRLMLPALVLAALLAFASPATADDEAPAQQLAAERSFPAIELARPPATLDGVEMRIEQTTQLGWHIALLLGVLTAVNVAALVRRREQPPDRRVVLTNCRFYHTNNPPPGVTQADRAAFATSRAEPKKQLDDLLASLNRPPRTRP